MKRFTNSRLMSFAVVVWSLAILPATLATTANAADLKILVVNEAAVFQSSLAGKDEANKLRAIFETIAAEEKAEMEPIAKEAQDLQGQKALLGDQFMVKSQELQRKAQFVQYKYEQERKITQERSRRLVLNELLPVFNEVMQEKNGTMLMEQSQLIMSSPDFNITSDVIRKLDAKMPSVDVKRVTFAEIQAAVEEQRKAYEAAQAKN